MTLNINSTGSTIDLEDTYLDATGDVLIEGKNALTLGQASSSEIDANGSISLKSDTSDVFVDYDLYAGQDVDITGGSAGGNIDLENAAIYAGDSTYASTGGNVNLTANNGSVVLDGSTISASGSGGINGNVTVNAGNGITVNNTSISADTEAGTIALTSASGQTAIANGSTMQAFYINVNSPDGILLTSTSYAKHLKGNQLTLATANSGSQINVANQNLCAFSTINMTAHTVNLLDVNFGSGSTVNLNSFFGLSRPIPTRARSSSPGYVNYINNVTYGGNPAQNYTTVGGSGAGINIGHSGF